MKLGFSGALALLGAVLASTAGADTTITVAVFSSLDRSTRAALPRWEKLHPDVKIKLVSLSLVDYHNAMITALAAGSNLPDVMAVEFGHIGRFAESGGLEDLGAAPYHGRPLLSRLLRFTGPQATSGGGALAAIPTDVGPGTLFYRKDILDRAGVTEAELTRSWESFIEAGKKVRAATGAHLIAQANDMMDIFIRANLKDGEGIYFDRQGNVLVDTPRFARAFELARAARAAGIDARVTRQSSEWAEGFRRGTIASLMGGAWLAGLLDSWIAPGTRGRWRSAQLPGGAFASWGGSFYAIPRKAEHKAEAWEFIKFMCFDREQQLEAFKSLDAYPALIAASDDPFFDAPVPFLGGQRARQIWKVAAARIPGIAVNKLDPIAVDVVAAELEQVLEQDKDVKQALADAKGQIERRVRR